METTINLQHLPLGNTPLEQIRMAGTEAEVNQALGRVAWGLNRNCRLMRKVAKATRLKMSSLKGDPILPDRRKERREEKRNRPMMGGW